MITTVKIDEIRIGERVRRDMGDMDSLIASIKELGLLQPIALRRGLSSKNGSGPILVAGARRVEACRRLGWDTIPVRFITTIRDAVQYLKAERDENTQRKDFAPSEAVAMGEKLEALEKPAAEVRKQVGRKSGGRGRKKLGGKLPHSLRTREKVGKAVGMSGKTYEKAKKVKAAAETNPDLFGDLLAVMDTKSVDAAFKELRARERHDEREAKAKTVAAFDGEFITDFSKVEQGTYACIYVDPPWQYDNQSTRASTDNHYRTMTVDELCKMPVGEKAAENCHLHLWTTNAFLFECPEIFDAWGFEFKSSFVWVKPQIGIGNYWRCAHEFLLLGVRGKLTANARNLRSWAEIHRGEHSEKPDEVRAFVEKLSPGPYLELFGRKPVKGWTVFGNEVIT